MTNKMVYALKDENKASFIQAAIEIASNKIAYNKHAVKSLNLKEHYFDLAIKYLGKDFAFLQDEVSTRLYIMDVLGREGLVFFEDMHGNIILDIEHALLLFYYLQAKNSPHINIAWGVLYFIAANQLDNETVNIGKATTKGFISPIFEYSPTQFRWKRCNYILRNYMLSLSQVEGYKHYTYQLPSQNQLAYLLSKGFDIGQAREYLGNSKGGLFYSFLPREVENALLPEILTGNFSYRCMDGYYKQALILDFEEVSKTYAISQVYNVYNLNVKPILIDMLGMIIGFVQTEIKERTKTDVALYHISPSRIGLRIREGLEINKLLPTLAGRFSEVKPMMAHNLLIGEHLY